MNDLRNTIAHILEHQQQLAEANEATTQQYVVLPILRALGWDDTNLAAMEVLPEYRVGNGNVDYALKIGQRPVLFIECKKWNEPIERHEGQIVKYAFEAGVRIVCLTNGKIWRFYFSWIEGSPVSERIFCEIDVEDRVNAISDLEKYLLKYNVVSGRAEDDAQNALKEKEKNYASKSVQFRPKISPANDIIDENPIEPESTVTGEWTIDRVRNSLSQELETHYENTFPEERLKLFYKWVSGVQNLIEKEGWKLNPPKFSKMLCGIWLSDKGMIGNIKRIFGILPDVGFPLMEVVGRDGEVIKKTRAAVPPRLFVRITEEEAKQLERQYGCEFCAVSSSIPVDYVYYDIPEDMPKLLPVLEFAYKKHSGN